MDSSQPAAASGSKIKKLLTCLPREVAVLLWLGVTSALATWGFIQGFIFNYADGWYGNYYTTVWICAFTWVLCIQAGLVFCKPELSTQSPGRYRVWLAYAFWMFACTVILLVGLGIALIGQFAWAFLWLPPVGVIAYGCYVHKYGPKAGQQYIQTVDVEAGARPSASKAKTAACRFLAFCGWSSIFWVAGLGFFLALQAAWLAADARAYPAPGVLVAVPQAGTSIVPKLHLRCRGNKTPGLSTMVVEPQASLPGIFYEGLVEQLVAGGRRACWHDRLGFGWSADAIKPTVNMRSARALRSLLAIAGEAAPYTLIGHGGGGQNALLFAAAYPNDTAGVVMVDSYDNVAQALKLDKARNVTVEFEDGSRHTRPNLELWNTPAHSAYLDFMRAITPFGWSRFFTNELPAATTAANMRNAAMGNNKQWHTRWVASVSRRTKGAMDAADQLSKAAKRPPFWEGTAWPTLGAKPVLLLPSADLLGLPLGCDADGYAAGTPACLAAVAASGDAWYAKLYLAYRDTLGTAVGLTVLPGSGAVLKEPAKVATPVLDAFRAV